MVEALKASYKKNYEWWISVEFLRQFVLIAFLVFYPGRTVSKTIDFISFATQIINLGHPNIHSDICNNCARICHALHSMVAELD